MKVRTTPLLIVALAALGACGPGGGQRAQTDLPGDPDSRAGFSAIGADEEIRFTGTEPFWGGSARGTQLTYTTPEDQAGTTIAVQRFGGRGGLSLSGTLDGRAFDMTVTPGTCSDGMSDRTYPFVVTLRLAGETRNGCGWTERRPFSGPARP